MAGCAGAWYPTCPESRWSPSSRDSRRPSTLPEHGTEIHRQCSSRLQTRPAMTHWTGWLELIAEQALLVAALLVVFEGCRRLVRDGMTRRAALMVAIGLIPPVADAWLNLNVMHSVRALQADKVAAVALHGREPAGGWEKAASSPEQRTALSYQAATVDSLF